MNNSIKIRLEYMKYVLEHKKNVFIEGRTVLKDMKLASFHDLGITSDDIWSMRFHLITHDMSKFSQYEFIQYARKFYGTYPHRAIRLPRYTGLYKEDIEYEFNLAWYHHYSKNKHHWEHWYDKDKGIATEMPIRYICQMVADWRAMSRKFGGTAQEYYLDNYHKIKLHNKSRYKLERLLGVIPPVTYRIEFKFRTAEDIIKICHQESFRRTLSVVDSWFRSKYNINIYEKFSSVLTTKEVNDKCNH